jgi:energy-coupling factor transporter transmembrane protein EcfT
MAIILPWIELVAACALLFSSKNREAASAIILALLVAFGVSMLSLTRCYVVPSFLIAGLAAAYLRMVASTVSVRMPQFDGRLLQRLVTGECALIMATYLFLKVMAMH